MCSNCFEITAQRVAPLGRHPDFRNTEGWKAVHIEKDIPFVTWKWSKSPRPMMSLTSHY